MRYNRERFFLNSVIAICYIMVSIAALSGADDICQGSENIKPSYTCPRPLPAARYSVLYKQYAEYWRERQSQICLFRNYLRRLQSESRARCRLCRETYNKIIGYLEENHMEKCAGFFTGGELTPDNKTTLSKGYLSVVDEIKDSEMEESEKNLCMRMAYFLRTQCLYYGDIEEYQEQRNISDGYSTRDYEIKQSILQGNDVIQYIIGDNICDIPLGESPENSPDDCRIISGDGKCLAPYETFETSPEDCEPPPYGPPITQTIMPYLEAGGVEVSGDKIAVSIYKKENGKTSSQWIIDVPRSVCEFSESLDKYNIPDEFIKNITEIYEFSEALKSISSMDNSCEAYTPCLFVEGDRAAVDKEECIIANKILHVRVVDNNGNIVSTEMCNQCNKSIEIDSENNRRETATCYALKECIYDNMGFYDDICRCISREKRIMSPDNAIFLDRFFNGVGRFFKNIGRDIIGKKNEDIVITDCALHVRRKSAIEHELNSRLKNIKTEIKKISEIHREILAYQRAYTYFSAEYQRNIPGINEIKTLLNSVSHENYEIPDSIFMYGLSFCSMMRTGTLQECQQYCRDNEYSRGICNPFTEMCQCVRPDGQAIAGFMAATAAVAGVCLLTAGTCAVGVWPYLMTIEFAGVGAYMGYLLKDPVAQLALSTDVVKSGSLSFLKSPLESIRSSSLDEYELEAMAASFEYGQQLSDTQIASYSARIPQFADHFIPKTNRVKTGVTVSKIAGKMTAKTLH